MAHRRTPIVRALALLAAAGILLGACAKPAEEASSTPHRFIGRTLRYDLDRPVNDALPVTLEFWTQADYEEIHAELIADYEKLHPNVDIRLTVQSWNDYRASLAVQLQSGLGPDIFHMHNSLSSALLPYLEPYPADRFPLDALEQDFQQIRSHVMDGYLYFIDTGLLTGAILYNRTVWNEHGLGNDYPKTWDELRELAAKLTEYGPDGSIVRSGFNPNGMGFALLAAMDLQKGVPLFSLSDPRKPLIATQAAADSLAFIRSFYDRRIADTRMPEAHESLGFGEASMIYAWGWVVNWLRGNAPDPEYGSFPLPSWDGAVPVAYDRNNGEVSMAVNRAASAVKQDAAFDLIQYYLASDTYLLEISSRFGATPSKVSLAEPLAEDDPLSAFRVNLERTEWPGPLPSAFEDHMVEYLIDPVIIDGADIRTALLATERVLTPIMKFGDFLSLESRYAHASEFRDHVDPLE